MTLLCVVTVVRNDPDGLHETLKSLADQAVAPDQLIVIDGSDDKDSVPAELAANPGLPAAYSWHPPRGVYAAMNTGLAEVTGDYVYFLNAGDTLASDDVIGRLRAALSDVPPLWAMGRVEFLAADGSTMPQPEWSYAEERNRLFARGVFPPHQGVVVRTDPLRQQGGFDTSYRVAADYASIMKLARTADPLELGFTMARFSVGGLSTTAWQQGLSEFHRARREAFDPTGVAAATELVRTGQRWLATAAYRSLWAPGRPLSGLAARIRPGSAR
jgi:glycosyltransferase involved in cell wall biosynthesis